MTRVDRRVSFPRTPAQVEACLNLAESGAIVVKRSRATAIVIMPVAEYERLNALDRLAAAKSNQQ